jgi:hypothetical protein
MLGPFSASVVGLETGSAELELVFGLQVKLVISVVGHERLSDLHRWYRTVAGAAVEDQPCSAAHESKSGCERIVLWRMQDSTYLLAL